MAKLFEKQRTNFYYNWLSFIEDLLKSFLVCFLMGHSVHTNYICIYARVLCMYMYVCTYVRICILYTSLSINQSIKIYIALLQDTYSEAPPTQAKRKRTVFRRWWNWEQAPFGRCLRSTGNPFQVFGPTAENERVCIDTDSACNSIDWLWCLM